MSFAEKKIWQHNGKIKIKTIKVQINNVNTHPFTVCYFMGGDKLRFGMYIVQCRNYHIIMECYNEANTDVSKYRLTRSKLLIPNTSTLPCFTVHHMLQ
jgi:hypothetical protein